MAAPTINATYTDVVTTAGTSATDNTVTGLNTGDLMILIGVIDEDVTGSIATTGITGMTQQLVEDTTLFLTVVVYTKVLVSGDTSATSIGLSWTGNQKAVMYAYHILAAEHDGISGTPAISDNLTDSTPDVPAYGDLDEGDNLVFAIMGSDQTNTVSSNPTGYATQDFDQATGSGGCSAWVGTDVLGGAQAANNMTLGAGFRNSTAIIGVKEGTGGGGSGPSCRSLSLGLRLGL